MNGILNVLKPSGMTSFDVVAYLRGVLKTKKIGHTGTLDPDAVGVLPICIGKATKAIEYIIDKNKTYRAELTLGITTDTQDGSGNIMSTKDVKVTNEDVESVIKGFLGEQMQMPPMYSAVRINGKKLYQLAREGKTIERQARGIIIHQISVVKIEHQTIMFDVTCSKGTYIRTLCHDIGEKLGCGGHMSYLLRTQSGLFTLTDTLTLEEISELSQKGLIQQAMLPTDYVFGHYGAIVIEGEALGKLLNGVAIEVKGASEGLLRIYGEDKEFIGIGQIVAGFLQIKKRLF